MPELWERQAEEAYLRETLDVIGEEQERAREQSVLTGERVESLRIRSGGTYSNDLMVQEEILSNLMQTVRDMELARPSPYFSRVDFKDSRHEMDGTFYIGKHGVIRSADMKIQVVDWRAPVANLYYAGQIGETHFETPVGRVDGELTRKRLFSIRDGVIESMTDADLGSQDELLTRALSQVSTEKLHEVVTTIQAEQNDVIRQPLDLSMLVAGVAGSGKTTIALHRVAFLLYTYRDVLRPGSMMILAPNPLFLDYIADVLPELGVDQARQTTFVLLCRSLLGKHMPRLARENEVEPAAARWMGQSRMLEYLDRYIRKLEKSMLPAGPLRFGPVTLLTPEEMEKIWITDLQPLPLHSRIGEVGKILKKKIQEAETEISAFFEKETKKREERLMQTLPDGEERRNRFRTLYASRDARLAQVREEAGKTQKQLLALFPSLKLLDCYREFLSSEPTDLPEEERTAWKRGSETALGRLSGNSVYEMDLPLLVYLCRALFGTAERLTGRHIVVDEAQDLSPVTFALLKKLLPAASWTVVGDMGQSIRSGYGLNSWEEAVAEIGENTLRKQLSTSYRNTVEIMTLANHVLARRPYPGQMLAQPVLRHGPVPDLHFVKGKKQRTELLGRLIDGYLAQGYRSVAVIERTEARARALLSELPERLQARYLRASSRESLQGVTVFSAPSVKGLEFDCVILSDVSETSFGDEDLDMHLLYVILTRALHNLSLVCEGTLSPLLKDGPMGICAGEGDSGKS